MVLKSDQLIQQLQGLRCECCYTVSDNIQVVAKCQNSRLRISVMNVVYQPVPSRRMSLGSSCPCLSRIAIEAMNGNNTAKCVQISHIRFHCSRECWKNETYSNGREIDSAFPSARIDSSERLFSYSLFPFSSLPAVFSMLSVSIGRFISHPCAV